MLEQQGSSDVPDLQREQLLAMALDQPGYFKRSNAVGDAALLAAVQSDDEATVQAAIRILLYDGREVVELAAAEALGRVTACSGVIEALN